MLPEKNLKELMHSKSVGNKRIVDLEALLVQESEAIKSLTMQCDDMKKAHKLSQTEMGRRYQDLFEAKEALDKENAVELLTAGKKRKSLESEMQQAKHELVARLDEANETQRVLQLRVTELTDQLKTTKSDLEGQLQQLSDTHDSHVKQSTAAAVITKKRVEALEAELQGSKDELSAHMTECTQQQRISTAKIAELQTKLEKTEWELGNQMKALVNERDDLLSNNASVGEATTKRIRSLEDDLESTREALLVSHDRIAALTAQLKESQAACERTLAQGTHPPLSLPYLFYVPSPSPFSRTKSHPSLAKSLLWRQSGPS